MNPQAKTQLDRKLDRLKASFRHAFALGSPDKPLTAEETALLEKVAKTIVRRKMSGPALLFLESAGPMNFLGSQALHFLAPILDLACDAREVELAAHLLERRDAISRLIAMIDAFSTPGTAAPQ
ncbi:MAG: hypothetical protein FJ245_04965 [Nitrospira sp.]|nr:hypothetical protein [Nitrospira sp.]